MSMKQTMPAQPRHSRAACEIDGSITELSSMAATGTLTLTDQAVSSGTNFALSGVALLALSQSNFGLFAIVQALYTLSLNITRALFLEPLLIQGATSSGERDYPVADAITFGCLTAGIGCGAVSAIVLFFNGAEPAVIGVFSVFLPALMVQDAGRYLSFRQLRPAGALSLDVAWAAAQTLVLVGSVVVGLDIRLPLVIFAWVVGGASGALMFQLRVRPSFHLWSIRCWLKESRALWPSLLTENLVANAAPSVLVIVLSVILARSEIAEIATPRTLLGPVNILFIGLATFGMAQGSRLRNRSRTQLLRFTNWLAVLLTAASLLLSVTLAAGAGLIARYIENVGVKDLRLYLIITGIGVAFNGFGYSQRVLVRTLKRPKYSALAEASIGVCILVFGVAGGMWRGSLGAIVGIALARACGVGVWIWSRFKAMSTEWKE